MHLSARQVNARTWPDRRVHITSPHETGPTQNEEHLFVLVKMIRSPSRRYRSDKLRHLLAAGLAVHQHAIPTIAGRHLSLVSQVHERRRRRRHLSRPEFDRTPQHDPGLAFRTL